MWPRLFLLTVIAVSSRVIAFFSLQSMKDDAARFAWHRSFVDKERVPCESALKYVSGSLETSF